MQSLLQFWMRSLRYVVSIRVIKHLFSMSFRSSVHVFTGSLAVFTAAVWLAEFDPGALFGWLRAFFALPLPLVSVLTSSFYLPLLLKAQRAGAIFHSYWRYIVSGVGYYGTLYVFVIFGLWVYWHAPAWVQWSTVVFGVSLAPFFILIVLCLPFILFGYSYPPMQGRAHRAIIEHGIRMTIHELPFLFLLLVYLMPLMVIFYGVPMWLIGVGILPAHMLLVCLHAGSLLYWQFGWAMAITFYQERKGAYI